MPPISISFTNNNPFISYHLFDLRLFHFLRTVIIFIWVVLCDLKLWLVRRVIPQRRNLYGWVGVSQGKRLLILLPEISIQIRVIRILLRSRSHLFSLLYLHFFSTVNLFIYCFLLCVLLEHFPKHRIRIHYILRLCFYSDFDRRRSMKHILERQMLQCLHLHYGVVIAHCLWVFVTGEVTRLRVQKERQFRLGRYVCLLVKFS